MDIGHLSKDESNYARAERDFKHKGVAAHPGDRGMQAIADAILEAIHGQKSPQKSEAVIRRKRTSPSGNERGWLANAPCSSGSLFLRIECHAEAWSSQRKPEVA